MMQILWTITEQGLTGTENQCLGVADALGLEPVIKRISLKEPWRTLSPHIGFENQNIFTGDPLGSPWPDIAIFAGRKAVAAARYIKKESHGKTLTVFLQNPGVCPSEFDLVAAPAHDNLKGDNVISTLGAPHRITSEKLATARQEFSDELSGLPGPRTAVLIGGSTKKGRMKPEQAQKIAESLLQIQGSLMITASRRTGEENISIFQNIFKNTKHLFWNGEGKNPYLGFLAWADHILVTEDSVSMTCEALTTGKPVQILSTGMPLSKRLRRFHQMCQERKFTRFFKGELEVWSYPPLNDSDLVAQQIRKLCPP